MRRIERELDIVRFIRTQLAIKAIIRALSTKVARQLAFKQYSLIIDDSQEEVTTTETDSDFYLGIFLPETRLEKELFKGLRKQKNENKHNIEMKNIDSDI